MRYFNSDYEANMTARAAAIEAARMRFATISEQLVAEAGIKVHKPVSSTDRGFSVVFRWVTAPFPAYANSQVYILGEQIPRVLFEHGRRNRSGYLDAFERHRFANLLLTFMRVTIPKSSTRRAKREVRKLIESALARTKFKIDPRIAEWAGARVPELRLSSKNHYDQIQGRVFRQASRLAGAVRR